MPSKTIISITLAAILIIIAAILLLWPWQSNAPTTSEEPRALKPAATAEPVFTPTALPLTQTTQPPSTKTLSAQSLPGVAKEFTFQATIPASWQVEAVPATEAINIYDPAAPGATPLEKSQIFIRFFSANSFLTLSTVNIHDRQAKTINGRPVVVYDIEKKAGVPPFAGQPTWRNLRHTVTDIRTSSANPSIFLVIAKRPDAPEAVYQAFLESLTLPGSTTLVPPVKEFSQRITKKPFGIYVSPDASPVTPERFTGYHTAVDIEFDDTLDPVPIAAVTDGRVVISQISQGYGGVVAIQHSINNQNLVAVYGHLDTASLPAVGTIVKTGDKIGQLGQGYTPDTDGERKHLHFGLSKAQDIRGYVPTKEELSNWIDPAPLF